MIGETVRKIKIDGLGRKVVHVQNGIKIIYLHLDEWRAAKVYKGEIGSHMEIIQRSIFDEVWEA